MVRAIGAVGPAAKVVTTAEQAATRGLSKFGGSFSREVNAAGGDVWTSIGEISQPDFKSIVNGGSMKGHDVHILSGVHGSPSGVIRPEAEFFLADSLEFGHIPGVTVHDFPALTSTEIKNLLQGPGTTIGAFCNSGVCLLHYK
jgi:hypothetical protein